MKKKLDDRSQFRTLPEQLNYDHTLSETTNDRLELTVIELQKLQKNNTHQTNKLGLLLGSLDNSVITLREELSDLNKTIKKANEQNNRIQVWFFTVALLGLFISAFGLIQVLDILIRGIGK